MNEQQKRFADYYIECGNASDAYKKAGYKAKGKSIEVNASRLLANAKVSEYVAKVMFEKDKERIASQDEILEYLTNVMRGDFKEETLIGEGKGAQSITNIDVSAKDRIKAAELLGKRYAMWTDNKNLSGTVGVTIVDDLDED
ncbi:terminase small subunit [Cytobacillus sp. FJAT-54145]|uniref:Terminase small subunit n=1 Tax=Cytobacillus spartinae TaxID=3299023 RepID=A0ABW6KIS8_9BACI